jgi:hypothetical protein
MFEQIVTISHIWNYNKNIGITSIGTNSYNIPELELHWVNTKITKVIDHLGWEDLDPDKINWIQQALNVTIQTKLQLCIACLQMRIRPTLMPCRHHHEGAATMDQVPPNKS